MMMMMARVNQINKTETTLRVRVAVVTSHLCVGSFMNNSLTSAHILGVILRRLILVVLNVYILI